MAGRLPGLDRRMSRRERLSVRAKAVVDDERVACVIRDRSEGGARLVFAEERRLPPRFLLVEEVNGVRREVKLIWAAKTECGVAFVV
jgi:hypothetical protein